MAFFGSCRVVTAGAASNGVCGIQLTSVEAWQGTAFDTVWFTAADTVKSQQLEVALDAITSNRLVMVATQATTPWAPLDSIYLLPAYVWEPGIGKLRESPPNPPNPPST